MTNKHKYDRMYSMDKKQIESIATTTAPSPHQQEYYPDGLVRLKYDNGALLVVAESVEPNNAQLDTVGQIIDGLPTNSYGICSGIVEILKQKEDKSLVVCADITLTHSMYDGGEIEEGFKGEWIVDSEGGYVKNESKYSL